VITRVPHGFMASDYPSKKRAGIDVVAPMNELKAAGLTFETLNGYSFNTKNGAPFMRDPTPGALSPPQVPGQTTLFEKLLFAEDRPPPRPSIATSGISRFCAASLGCLSRHAAESRNLDTCCISWTIDNFFQLEIKFHSRFRFNR
jgi:hypothetical protein